MPPKLHGYPVLSPAEGITSPPELPPRNILSYETKEFPASLESARAPEVNRPSPSETLLQRLQTVDTSG